MSAPRPNMRRGVATCSRGHEFTPDNTYWRGNARICRACRRELQTEHRANMGLKAPEAVTPLELANIEHVAALHRYFERNHGGTA